MARLPTRECNCETRRTAVCTTCSGATPRQRQPTCAFASLCESRYAIGHHKRTPKHTGHSPPSTSARLAKARRELPKGRRHVGGDSPAWDTIGGAYTPSGILPPGYEEPVRLKRRVKGYEKTILYP